MFDTCVLSVIETRDSCSIAAALENVVDAPSQSSIRSWTHNDVKSWLKDVGLEDRSVTEGRDVLEGGYECTVCENGK